MNPLEHGFTRASDFNWQLKLAFPAKACCLYNLQKWVQHVKMSLESVKMLVRSSLHSSVPLLTTHCLSIACSRYPAGAQPASSCQSNTPKHHTEENEYFWYFLKDQEFSSFYNKTGGNYCDLSLVSDYQKSPMTLSSYKPNKKLRNWLPHVASV